MNVLNSQELAEVNDSLENINRLNEELSAVDKATEKRKSALDDPRPGPSGYNLRSAAKRQNVDMTEDMEVEQQQRSGALRIGGHGSSSSADCAAGTGDGNQLFLWKSVTSIKSADIHFMNTHLFSVWGFGYSWFDVKAANETVTGAR